MTVLGNAFPKEWGWFFLLVVTRIFISKVGFYLSVYEHCVGRKVLGLDDGTAVNYSYFKVFDRHTDIHEITPCRPA